MPESQVVEQKEVIRDFKSKFYADYGVNLHVFVPPKEDNKITLTTLEIVTLATPVSYTHLRAHETGRNLVCRLLL